LGVCVGIDVLELSGWIVGLMVCGCGCWLDWGKCGFEVVVVWVDYWVVGLGGGLLEVGFCEDGLACVGRYC